jgi:iron complex transport system ATP-binding protein
MPRETRLLEHPLSTGSRLPSGSMEAVTATDVEFRYGSQVAIAASSFTIPVEAVTTLIGPNGSGKSTILNAIAGLTSPTSGTLTVSGASTRSRIAFVLQTTKVNNALPITVREVVSMGRYPSIGEFKRLGDSDRAIVTAALQRMSITNLSSRHLTELSGGQRQRVFVAQGLAQDHDMLLLDEPLTGLDLPSAKAIDDLIHDEQSRGGTVIVSTHDLAEARVADHVVLLAGRVIASGTPSEVLTPSHLRTAYGAAHLHLEGEQFFLDDPAHRPTDQPHVHQDRSIHLKAIHEDNAT